jgi:hypothetical protein
MKGGGLAVGDTLAMAAAAVAHHPKRQIHHALLRDKFEHAAV